MARDRGAIRWRRPTTATRVFCLERVSCAFLLVDLLDFGSKALRNRVAPQLTIRREQAILDAEGFGRNVKTVDLFVVRCVGVQSVDGGLNARIGEAVSGVRRD